MSVEFEPEKVGPAELLSKLTKARKYAKSSIVSTGAVATAPSATARATVKLEKTGDEGELRVEVAPPKGKTLAKKRPELKLGDGGGRILWAKQERVAWDEKWPFREVRAFSVSDGEGEEPEPLVVSVTYYEEGDDGEPVERTVELPIRVTLKD